MIGPLNHVGIAVPSIETAAKIYKNLYGVVNITEPGELPAQGVRFCFVNLPNSQIELIEPLGENSPIDNFLVKNPKGGQHHVCFEVDDVHLAKKEMEEKGAKVLNEPRIGAHGTLVIFVHPKDSSGVLIELMEPNRE
ncbi:MAG: methylmalonyl-CoA epimerase [Alphaproteobacteria bacterium]|jgi:methylmalonyl-CoA/ethylmalonyl-CoA epimerase|nr:MAG: methylmalonyl-CoA epimerase [alpha proteobacterium MED-G09]|tara:strand:- start:7645 stop:8055 length:411 start_codon:yes stop_codon:yes gene_type:complete